MIITPEMVCNGLKTIISKESVNIFDVFAGLYPYCDQMYGEVHEFRSIKECQQQIDNRSYQIQRTILPDLTKCCDPLNDEMKEKILGKLTEKDNFHIRCFTILYAIDRLYDNLYGELVLRSKISNVNFNLNMEIENGYVFTKPPIPILNAISIKIKELEQTTGKRHFESRTGKEKGHFLRDHLQNLVFVPQISGLEIRYKILRSDLRSNFPKIENCLISAIPLIRNKEQIVNEFFEINQDEQRPFVIKGLIEEGKIAEKAIMILKKANDNGSTVVIFPELSISSKIRKKISSEMAKGNLTNIKMIVAGAVHDKISDRWYNTAYVLGPNGEEIWHQNKFEPYTLTKYEAYNNPFLTKLSDHNYVENINAFPKVLEVRDTSLGRMAILICSDFLLDDTKYHRAVIEMGVNFLMVPAMTANIDHSSFLEQASKFSVSNRATTVISNSCVAAVEEIDKNNSKYKKILLVYIPEHEHVMSGDCQDCGKSTCRGIDCINYKTVSLNDWKPSLSENTQGE